MRSARNIVCTAMVHTVLIVLSVCSTPYKHYDRFDSLWREYVILRIYVRIVYTKEHTPATGGGTISPATGGRGG